MDMITKNTRLEVNIKRGKVHYFGSRIRTACGKQRIYHKRLQLVTTVLVRLVTCKMCLKSINSKPRLRKIHYDNPAQYNNSTLTVLFRVPCGKLSKSIMMTHDMEKVTCKVCLMSLNSKADLKKRQLKEKSIHERFRVHYDTSITPVELSRVSVLCGKHSGVMVTTYHVKKVTCKTCLKLMSYKSGLRKEITKSKKKT